MLDCPAKRRLLAPVIEQGTSTSINRNIPSYPSQRKDSMGSLIAEYPSSKLSPRRQFIDTMDADVINRLSRVERVQNYHAMDPSRNGPAYGLPFKGTTPLPDPFPSQHGKMNNKYDKNRDQAIGNVKRQLPPIAPPNVPLPSMPPPHSHSHGNPLPQQQQQQPTVAYGRQGRGSNGQLPASTRPW